jgi:hypothetical protein
MRKNKLIKFSLVIFSLVFMTASCQLSKKNCLPDQSILCKKAVSDWQASIDYIIKSNFPPDYGYYKAVVWDEDFENAWVTKGRQINITKRLLDKLNVIGRICVAAHELAHLKMGHYYSRIGIIIVNDKNTIPENTSNDTSAVNHYGIGSPVDIPEGFGINQEIEADKMALKFIKQSGLNINHYLQLLMYLQGPKKDPNSLIFHRIVQIKKLR